MRKRKITRGQEGGYFGVGTKLGAGYFHRDFYAGRDFLLEILTASAGGVSGEGAAGTAPDGKTFGIRTSENTGCSFVGTGGDLYSQR